MPSSYAMRPVRRQRKGDGSVGNFAVINIPPGAMKNKAVETSCVTLQRWAGSEVTGRLVQEKRGLERLHSVDTPLSTSHASYRLPLRANNDARLSWRTC